MDQPIPFEEEYPEGAALIIEWITKRPALVEFKPDRTLVYRRVNGRLQRPQVYAEPTVGRNDPCPCQSGIKFKRCCGRNS